MNENELARNLIFWERSHNKFPKHELFGDYLAYSSIKNIENIACDVCFTSRLRLFVSKFSL